MAFLTEKEKKKELKTNIQNYMKMLFRKGSKFTAAVPGCSICGEGYCCG